jgi:hypothetical protein
VGSVFGAIYRESVIDLYSYNTFKETNIDYYYYSTKRSDFSRWIVESGDTETVLLATTQDLSAVV